MGVPKGEEEEEEEEEEGGGEEEEDVWEELVEEEEEEKEEKEEEEEEEEKEEEEEEEEEKEFEGGEGSKVLIKEPHKELKRIEEDSRGGIEVVEGGEIEEGVVGLECNWQTEIGETVCER